MPLIETKGAASSQGFGRFTKLAPETDGTRGIFAIGRACTGAGVTTRNKYTYSSCASTASGVGAASRASYGGSAAGNSTRGIFALGGSFTGCPNYCGRDKYIYASCTSTTSGVPASNNTFYGAAAGNGTRGIFQLGSNGGSATNTRLKYTYASDTSTTSGVATASANNFGSAAAGNSTRGIFQLGGTSLACARFNKYTYACCTSVNSVSLCYTAYGAAAGNSTRGIFARGQSNSGSRTFQRYKFTYASCTLSYCIPSATRSSEEQSATGNSTRGIFALGLTTNSCGVACLSNIRDKYTYSSCTNTASGVGTASSPSRAGSAVSWATCVNP